MMKKKIIVTVVILGLVLLALPSFSQATDDPDYNNTWEMPADGSNDTTEYYKIVRSNGSQAGSIEVSLWESNKTILIDFTNIKSVSLYLNATDIDLSQYKDMLSMGSEINLILRADTDHIDFSISGIPEFSRAKLDGSSWDDYTYYSSNETIQFDLDMSDHTIVLEYENIFIGYIMWTLELFLVISLIGIVLQVFSNTLEEGGASIE